MKILLVNPKNRFTKSVPLSLAYLAAVLEKEGHNVRVYDPTPKELRDYIKRYGQALTYDRAISFESQSYLPHFEKFLKSFSPELVGFSSMTAQVPMALAMAQLVKKCLDIPTIFGGVHPSSMPFETLKYQDVDSIVIGEGERTICDLAETIENNKSIENVKGIGYKKSGKLFLTEQRPLIENIDELPFPARHLFPMNWYTQRSAIMGTHWLRATNMITGRGCPFNCIFCASRKVWGGDYRMHSAHRVVDEIEHMMNNYKLEGITFDDDTFTINRKRTIAICKEIQDRGLNFLWSAQMRTDTVHEDILREIKKADCVRISFGVESGSDKVLEALNKGTHVYQAKNAFDLCKKYRIKTRANFMIVNPEETIEDIQKTKKLAHELNADFTVFFITISYPGTPLYEMAIKNKWIKNDVPLEEYMHTLGTDLEISMEIDFDSEELKKILVQLKSEFSNRELITFLKQRKFIFDMLLITIKQPQTLPKVVKQLLRTGNLKLSLREFMEAQKFEE